MPTLLLLLALATVFVFGGGRDHPYHEGQDHHDELSWLHMTVALNLSPAHGFLGFDRLVRDADGDVDYEAYNRFPVLGHALIRLATLPFPEDAPAQLAAARLLMLAFFAAAATLAYSALCRLAGSRWAALAATLLAFSGYYALYYNDMVATQGVVDLFGLMLVFHGMAVFAAEGRFGQLLAKTCAALLLGWHVYALLLPFVLLGLAVACHRRDWAGFRHHFTLGAVAVTFGTIVLAANFSQEYLAYGGEVAPTRLPSVESMLYRTGLAGLQADAGEAAGDEADAAASAGAERTTWQAMAKRQLKRMAWSAPYAVGYFVGDGRPETDLAKARLLAVLGLVAFGLLAAIALVLFASPATRHRLPLAALALAGPLWGFGLPNSYFAFEGLFYVGVPLAFFALVLQHLDRLARGRVGALAGVAAAATFVLSSFLMARATMPNSAHVAYERALAADVHAIREELLAAPERKTILVSDAMDACSKYGQPGGFEPWRVDWKYHLAGLGMAFVKSSARRFADFVVSERIDGARTLTPGNRLLFLYDRASHEDALRRYEQYAQRRTPVLDAPNYDVYFVERNAGRDELLYFRDHCPTHQVNDRFFAERIMMARDARVFVRVWPVDANDLPADRRQSGFETVVDFEQLLSGWRQDGQCYAACRLPDYDIASIRAGTAAIRRRESGVAPRASYDVIWEGSFSPRQAAGSAFSSPAERRQP